MRRSELVTPGRVGRDYNSVSHFWTYENLTGAPLTAFDMFFGTLQGGTTGMNPVMDKHYKLENIGLMLRHLSPTNPVVTVNWRRNENPANQSTFAFTPTDRVGGANKRCGSWSNSRPRPPCGSYNLLVSVGAPGIAFVRMMVVLSYKIMSDNK